MDAFDVNAFSPGNNIDLVYHKFDSVLYEKTDKFKKVYLSGL